jgi:hypothetical protein
MIVHQFSEDEIWLRICAMEGEEFETKTGKPFTFEISGNTFHPSRTQYNIAKADFQKALNLVPIEGPGVISNLVRGSTYIWAVLHDRRVRWQDW